MENRKTARTCVMFVVFFVLTVHGGAARPVRSGSDRTLKEQNELQAHAPDAATGGTVGTGGSGVGDQKNFLPLGGVGMGAGMGGYAGMGSYVGGVMPMLGGVGEVGGGFGMGSGFGAGGGASVGGMGAMGTGPLGGLGGLNGLGVARGARRA
ncbi:glycine-rich cell wall structural protein 1-like [Syzygium oleosum]|uniref:glycine-rich cell wall structural protein 1-like n=1 Tax=Syzygium oleosum TaxID=219896 RepID=UPI0011D1A83E|nr:glycine-rich cell wall structural protein 1-like [Syzygium oleosum]